MWRTISLSLLALCMTACPTFIPAPSPAEETEIHAEGTYVHAPSHLEFPVSVGTFHRAQMTQFNRDGTDVGIGYNYEKVDACVAFTVYVKPAPQHANGKPVALGEEFESVLATIREHHPGAVLQWSGGAPNASLGPAVTGLAAEFQYRELFAFREQMIVSRAYLFERDGWFVKYRVSYAVGQRSVAQPIVETFLANAPWGRKSS